MEAILPPRTETRAQVECVLLSAIASQKCWLKCRARAASATLNGRKHLLFEADSVGKQIAAVQTGCHDKYFGLAAMSVGLPGRLKKTPIESNTYACTAYSSLNCSHLFVVCSNIGRNDSRALARGNCIAWYKLKCCSASILLRNTTTSRVPTW